MIYKHAAQVTYRYFQDEALLLDVTNGCTFHLNRVGTLIWKVLDGKTDTEEIKTYLKNKYGLSAEQAHQDLERFIHLLIANKLIEPIGSEGD